MRTSMLPTLLKTLSYNYAQRTAVAKIFEVAFVYIKDEDVEKLPEHREQLCMACYGNTDFFALKGEVEVILDTLKIKDAEFEPVCDNPSMHPGRCAKLVVKGKDIGFFGQVHPIVAENFECPVESYVAIIDLKPLVDNCVEIPKSKELPKFPAVTRDLAVVVDKGVPAGHVEKIIRQRGGKLLESCALFDCYEGAQLPEGKKSLAYSLAFRTPDGTLTDEDVSKPMKKILNGLETMLGAELR
jgi:phenylalanyl-tRNA synthetase beta chain